MQIGRLKEFIFLANSLSFTMTAKHFYISSSVLSKHIASIEKELGTPLFVRGNHHTHLTRSGELFYEDALSIVHSYERALTRIAAVNESFKTVVHIGYLRNASRPFLTTFARYMNKNHPDVQTNLTCMEYGETYFALSTKKIDIALTIDLNPLVANRCESLPLYEDRFKLIVSRDHELAAYETEGITSEMLKDVPVMLPSSSGYPGLADFIERIIPQDHAAHRRYYNDIDTLFLAVGLGSYAGFSSEHNEPAFDDQICFIPINDRQTNYQVSALWRHETSEDIVGPCRDALQHCHRILSSKARSCKADGARKN